MLIKKAHIVKFIVTTTEGQKINVVYKGRSSRKCKMTRKVLDRLKNKYNIHPERVQELLLFSNNFSS